MTTALFTPWQSLPFFGSDLLLYFHIIRDRQALVNWFSLVYTYIIWVKVKRQIHFVFGILNIEIDFPNHLSLLHHITVLGFSFSQHFYQSRLWWKTQVNDSYFIWKFQKPATTCKNCLPKFIDMLIIWEGSQNTQRCMFILELTNIMKTHYSYLLSIFYLKKAESILNPSFCSCPTDLTRFWSIVN